MERKGGVQYAAVEQPCGVDPPTVHCPICGKAQLKPGQDGAEPDPCPHCAFIFCGEAGEFVYQSKNFGERTSFFEEEEDGVDCGNLKELLEKAKYDNGLLVLEVTYGGIACGPVWFTDAYGFDYGTLEEDDEE